MWRLACWKISGWWVVHALPKHRTCVGEDRHMAGSSPTHPNSVVSGGRLLHYQMTEAGCCCFPSISLVLLLVVITQRAIRCRHLTPFNINQKSPDTALAGPRPALGRYVAFTSGLSQPWPCLGGESLGIFGPPSLAWFLMAKSVTGCRLYCPAPRAASFLLDPHFCL